MLRVAVLTPAEVGLNVTATRQVPARAIDAQPGPGVAVNKPASGPTTVAPLTFRVVTPVLVTVMFCTAEVAPTLVLAKFSVVAESPTAGATGTSWNALQFLVTASLPVQNRRFSMFQSVSIPSPLAKRSAAATNALSATVMLPSAFGVMV